jgi:hypothetical protein
MRWLPLEHHTGGERTIGGLATGRGGGPAESGGAGGQRRAVAERGWPRPA